MFEPLSIADAAATPDARSAMIELLAASGLPTTDLLDHPLQNFFVAREGGVLVGTIGLEIAGEVALMRSLAVRPAMRGRQIAHELWRTAHARAAALGVREVFLLTTTAAPLFERWGFQRSSRDRAPAAVRSTAEFQTLCPETATLMRLAL